MKPNRIAILVPFAVALAVLVSSEPLSATPSLQTVCQVDTGLTVESSAEGSCTYGFDEAGGSTVEAYVSFRRGASVRVGIDAVDLDGDANFSDWSESGEVEYSRVSNQDHHTVTVQTRSETADFELGVAYG